MTPFRTTVVTAFHSTKKEQSYEAPRRREPDDNDDDQADNALDAAAVALSKLRSITDKYLECPTLLDLYLEMMSQRLSLPARGIVRELFLFQSHDNADAIAAADNNNIIDDGESNDDGIPA